MSKYTSYVPLAERDIIGRDTEMRSVLAAFMRPELSNVMLLGDAGSGKTALIQGLAKQDSSRTYLLVDLAKMISETNDSNEMANRLTSLFQETTFYAREEGRELVLFLDEFHQIVQLSAVAVEAIKPLLADSGTRNTRVVAATTYEEFRKYISSNQPLVERFMRVNLAQSDRQMTVTILKGMATRYGVDNQFFNNHIFEMIYEYTNRYVPANSQPRKSILVLDAMIGWHKAYGRKLDKDLLADVIKESEGVDVAFTVDARAIKDELDRYVLSQDYATTVVEQRLQLCVADLNDKGKPMSSFLFTGSTGVGKSEMTKQLARILFADSRNLIRFDMTEYSTDDSLVRFMDEMTSRVWERPNSLILLDEIEKASPLVTRVLLQVLDDGRLTDRNGREISFVNSYIVLTTNTAAEVYKLVGEYNPDDKGSGDTLKSYDRLIRRSIVNTAGGNRFPPELLGRINTIVPFQPLSRDTMKRIATKKLVELKAEVLEKHGVVLMIEQEVVKYLVEDNLTTDSDAGGARVVISKLEDEVTTNVARFINENPDATKVGVKVEGDMRYGNKDMLDSGAYIRVAATR